MTQKIELIYLLKIVEILLKNYRNNFKQSLKL